LRTKLGNVEVIGKFSARDVKNVGNLLENAEIVRNFIAQSVKNW
jgi:hypothetical protein